MEILHLRENKPALHLDSIEQLPATGTIWINFTQGGDPSWPEIVARLTGFTVHERHIQDAANEAHPSFTDSTDEYELIVFRSLSPSDEDGLFATRATAFFLFERLLVTVSPVNSRSIRTARQRFISGKGRLPVRPVGIAHLVLNNMVDRFLLMREHLISRLSDYRQVLLDPKESFDNWPDLLDHQKQIFSLALISEAQSDALTVWKDNTDYEIDDHLSVRLADLLNHIRRVSEFSENQQREIDSLIQLHFSAVAHRTNEIVRVLTLISAIFLPLTLIAGIYGMNFEYMPELKSRYGYILTLGGMLLLVVGLLGFFKARKWF